jgi:homoserine O-acetyltransferase
MSAACREPEHAKTFESSEPLALELGGTLPELQVCYETWGKLDADASNAVLICHALTGDSHVARHDDADAPGWWDLVVGPGRYLDTDRLYVVCSNTLGGCSGTTGPGSIDPRTGKPFNASFPAITQRDAVEAQRRLIEHLGIGTLRGVIGGSMGGQQALQWALDHGDQVDACVLLATSPRLTSQALAFDIVGRNAILQDSHFHDGDYEDAADKPRVGLALARMLAHITYLSRDGMTAKFDPERDKPRDLNDDFAAGFESNYGVGSYLAHQGGKFIERFDANSYVTLTRAMDRFDLGATAAELGDRFEQNTSAKTRFSVASFSSDWLFPPEQSRQIVAGLCRAQRRVSYVEITSNGGHDAFLLPDEIDQYGSFLKAAISNDELASPDVGDRLDHDVLLDLVPKGASVLDLGCGDGVLMDRLRRRGHHRLVGVDVTTANVLAATARGLDVIDADLNQPLTFFDDGQFDVVVLSQALQSVENTLGILAEILRVGRQGIVSFPNFAYAPLRTMLAKEGRSPKTDTSYAFEWYDSPNRRFPTIRDFTELCDKLGLVIDRGVWLDTERRAEVIENPNLNADLAIVMLSKPTSCLA